MKSKRRCRRDIAFDLGGTFGFHGFAQLMSRLTSGFHSARAYHEHFRKWGIKKYSPRASPSSPQQVFRKRREKTDDQPDEAKAKGQLHQPLNCKLTTIPLLNPGPQFPPPAADRAFSREYHSDEYDLAPHCNSTRSALPTEPVDHLPPTHSIQPQEDGMEALPSTTRTKKAESVRTPLPVERPNNTFRPINQEPWWQPDGPEKDKLKTRRASDRPACKATRL